MERPSYMRIGSQFVHFQFLQTFNAGVVTFCCLLSICSSTHQQLWL